MFYTLLIVIDLKAINVIIFTYFLHYM